MIIETRPVSGISNFPIRYDPAVYEEQEGPIQTSLFASLNQRPSLDEDVSEDLAESNGEESQ